MAVFTPVSFEEAQAFLDRFDAGRLVSLDPISEGVENSNFRFETTTGVFALTLFEKRVSPDDLPFFLGLMEHAALKGLPTPRPLRDRAGRLIGVLNHRAAALVAWLPGRWPRHPDLAQQWAGGGMLARLHQACGDFSGRRDNALGPDGWIQLVERCGWRARGEDLDMLKDLEAEARFLSANWPRDLPTGPIHGDFFPDNVLFEGAGVSGVIDFYFACVDALAYDLAIALNAWGFDGDGRAIGAAMKTMTEGYGSVRSLSAPEWEAMPLLCRGAAVRFTLTRLHDRLFHDPSWLVTPKDPTPFHRRLVWHRAQRASAYGAVSAAG